MGKLILLPLLGLVTVSLALGSQDERSLQETNGKLLLREVRDADPRKGKRRTPKRKRKQQKRKFNKKQVKKAKRKPNKNKENLRKAKRERNKPIGSITEWDHVCRQHV